MHEKRLILALFLALASGACSSEPATEAKPETPAQREARIEKAIAANAKDPWPYYERGTIEEARGDLSRAVEDYGAAVSLLPPRKATRPALALGRVHSKLGHLEPARRMLEEVVTTVPAESKNYVENPDFREAALLLRQVYAKQGDEKSAEKLKQRFVGEFGGKPEEWDAAK